MKKALVLLGGFVLVAGMMGTAQAIPVLYRMTFQVIASEGIREQPPIPGEDFDPVPAVGDLFHGFVILDDALLHHDGINQPAVLSAFHLEVAGVVWDLSPLVPSIFDGFLGPVSEHVVFGPCNVTGDPDARCRFASSPGFDVIGGQIVAMRGGPFGIADIPLFDCFAGGCITVDGSADVRGPLTFTRLALPTPATVLLIGAGLLGMLLRRR